MVLRAGHRDRFGTHGQHSDALTRGSRTSRTYRVELTVVREASVPALLAPDVSASGRRPRQSSALGLRRVVFGSISGAVLRRSPASPA
ncbi:hypothetical protein GCM10023320_40440 [Pseudonocardia adelaidensis]|uniref:Uncharacterized protein n=1 Tax=Pseudonocardia adelaidensis TaxID=648754 RepID=A0ABP9NLN2_9PSEU